MNHELSHHDPEPPPFWRSRYAVGLLVMGAIAAYFLLSEHRAHFLGALPLLLLLLLACPLMHVFMHHGHGDHGGGHAHHHEGESTSTPPPRAPTLPAGDRP